MQQRPLRLLSEASKQLLRRVGVDVCNQIMSDMEPYVDCALQRSESRQRRNGNQRSVRADALPARSEASWPIVAHPALLAIAEAVLVSRTIAMIIATTWPAFSKIIAATWPFFQEH